MQQILEFIPLVLFFLAYFSKKVIELGPFNLELGNMYAATIVLMGAMALQLLLSYIIYKKVEKRHWVMFIIVVIFGGLTLFLKNNVFIQWKPTIANWCFASAFLVAPYFTGGQSLAKKTMGEKIDMPDFMWARLTKFLVGYFIFMGVLNLVVVYNFSEAAWVTFKLWSTPIASILVSIIIIYLVYPYIDTEALEANHKKKKGLEDTKADSHQNSDISKNIEENEKP